MTVFEMIVGTVCLIAIIREAFHVSDRYVEIEEPLVSWKDFRKNYMECCVCGKWDDGSNPCEHLVKEAQDGLRLPEGAGAKLKKSRDSLRALDGGLAVWEAECTLGKPCGRCHKCSPESIFE